MELNIKKGNVYHVALNSQAMPALELLDEEDYAAYLAWAFLPSGLPGYQDVKCLFGFELTSLSFFVDEWSCNQSEDPEEVIKKYWNDALETLIRRGAFATALELHKKELLEY